MRARLPEMSETIDLSNPDFEPTDEQLGQLASRAFAGGREKHEQSMRSLRARIAEEREAVLARFGAKPAPRP